jgi:hypothetical protein
MFIELTKVLFKCASHEVESRVQQPLPQTVRSLTYCSNLCEFCCLLVTMSAAE